MCLKNIVLNVILKKSGIYKVIKMELTKDLNKSDKNIKLKQLKVRVEILIHEVKILQEKLSKLENDKLN